MAYPLADKGENAVIDRRMMLAAGMALPVAGTGLAKSVSSKAASIDAVQLPAGSNGLLAYGRNGKLEHLRSVGFADMEARVPFGARTQTRWGSASKWLTSVAVLRLVEQRMLDLDAPIVRYLPDFRRDTGERVLLAHLLSNTSGIPDLMSRQVKVEPALRLSSASSAAMVARFAGGDLAFEPGRGWDYSALNWTIIGAIVERATGEPLAAVVKRLVFEPLAMSGAGFAQADQAPLPHLAAAYRSGVPPVRKMGPVPPFVAASGNVAGAVGDAIRAAHGVFHGRLLRPVSRAALTTVRWPEQEYALGGRVHPIDGRSWAWETGKVEGYRTHIAHRLDHSETVVVFNTTDMDQGVIGGWVEAIVRA
jgi:D-alanyl-D-alanine carboxypeptidase